MSVIQVAGSMLLGLYLAVFISATSLASRAVGRSVWLFGAARGKDRWAAFGFRGSFFLALVGPPLWALAPALSGFDPLWTPGLGWTALPGHALATAGAMVAFAAQMAMGASWRVGVNADAVGGLVSDELYSLSRNPAFLGQTMLLLGVAISTPSLPGVAAVVMFVTSAEMQIRSEEAVLARYHGDKFLAFKDRVPRWL